MKITLGQNWCLERIETWNLESFDFYFLEIFDHSSCPYSISGFDEIAIISTKETQWTSLIFQKVFERFKKFVINFEFKQKPDFLFYVFGHCVMEEGIKVTQKIPK